MKYCQCLSRLEQNDVNTQDRYRSSVLHKAVEHNQLAVVNMLLEAGAMVNHKDSTRSTPLHVATTKKNKAVAKKLLEAGTDVTAVNMRGNTVLDICLENKSGIIGLLRGYGGKTNHEVEISNFMLNEGNWHDIVYESSEEE